MIRAAVPSFVCLLVFAAPLSAEEVKGTFVKYEEEKKLLVLKIEEDEQPFELNDDTVLYTLAGKPNKFGLNGLKRFKIERMFLLKTEVKDGKTVVLEVRPQR